MQWCQPDKVIIFKNKPPLLVSPLLAKLQTTKKKIIVLQGGGSAGKTTTVLQWLALKAIESKNQQITIVGIDVPNLKRGAMRTFKRYVAESEQIKPFITSFNKTDREYYFNNGSIISFVSYEDDTDARGAEHDYVFMNEANLMSYNLFWELQRKCKYNVILDYNPTYSYWAHAKLVQGGEKQFEGKVQQYIVDHRHNPFLTDDEHNAYENISDPEKFRVYSRGLTGKVSGAIFNFKTVDEIPENLPFGFGMDFGYTHDKTTIVKVYMNGKDRYYQVLLYKSNQQIQDDINENNLNTTVEAYIAKILFDNGYNLSNTLLWGDHDKSMSIKLRKLGIGFRMAKKKNIVATISSVQRYNGFIYRSPDLENEIKTFIWQTAVDTLTGNEVNTGVPIDGMPDDAIAAIRYFSHSYANRFSGDE